MKSNRQTSLFRILAPAIVILGGIWALYSIREDKLGYDLVSVIRVILIVGAIIVVFMPRIRSTKENMFLDVKDVFGHETSDVKNEIKQWSNESDEKRMKLPLAERELLDGLEEAYAKHPEPRTMFVLAKKLYEMKFSEETLSLCNEIVRLYPESSAALWAQDVLQKLSRATDCKREIQGTSYNEL